MMRTLKGIFVLSLIIACTCVTMAQSDGVKKSKKKPKPKIAPVSFKNNVFPIIKQYCLPCHSEAQMNPSELYLESFDQLMAGGKHGKSIKPGKADSSLVISKLSPTPPFGDPMPMKAKTPMTDSSINVIKKWINQGAKNN